MKHTPGPWEVRGLSGNTWVVRRGYITLAVLDRKDQPEMNEPNARLIAAAPETAAERDHLKKVNAELSRALRRIIEGLQFIERRQQTATIEIHCLDLEAANIAIAKATGGE